MSFDAQPFLSGQLVELRPLRAADYDDLYRVASDPLIWEQHPDRRHEAERFRVFFRESLESGGCLVAIDTATGRIIGSSRFHGYDPDKRQVEIGWSFLARSHWGGVYNGEMKQLMVQHALRFTDRIVFFVDLDNVRSQRAVEKIGAIRTGTVPDGTGGERYAYSLTTTPQGPTAEDERPAND